jgi:hypothetical protein
VAAFIWGIGIRRLIDAIRRENCARRRLPWRAAEPGVVVSAEDQVLAGIEHMRTCSGQPFRRLVVRPGPPRAVGDSQVTAETPVLPPLAYNSR